MKLPQADVFPFFVGTGRSGTTLIRALFDTHPQVAIPPVSDFVVPMLTRKGRYEGPGSFAIELFVSDLFAFERFRRWDLSLEEVAEAIATLDPATCADAIVVLYQLYASKRDKTRYGDKTASYVLHMPLLAEAFPSSRFVHMIRDGRDVALSYMESKAQKWGPRNIRAGTVRWKRRIEEGRRAGTVLGPARYREVRYEDLVDSPIEVLKGLCEFLEVEFDEAMLSFHERAGEIVEPLTNPTANANIYRPLSRTSRDWKREMTPSELGFFETLAGSTLRRFGYEPTGRAIPLRTRLSARAQVISFKLRTSLQRAKGFSRAD